MIFQKINHINIEKENWRNNIFLTFDLDWVNDPILLEIIEFVEKFNVKATWFITHKTKLLDKLRENPNFELGIHPNFNQIVKGEHFHKINFEKIVDDLLVIVPEAVSVRSHCLFQSSTIMDLFAKKKLKYDCNDYISYDSGIILKPWRIWNNIIKVPHLYEDDIFLMSKNKPNLSDILLNKGLKVFNFHPIHIYLNSENIHRYQNNKNKLNFQNKVVKLKFQGYGIKNILLDLISKYSQ